MYNDSQQTCVPVFEIDIHFQLYGMTNKEYTCNPLSVHNVASSLSLQISAISFFKMCIFFFLV